MVKTKIFMAMMTTRGMDEDVDYDDDDNYDDDDDDDSAYCSNETVWTKKK